MLVLLDITKDNQDKGLIFWLLRTNYYNLPYEVYPVGIEYKFISFESLNAVANMSKFTGFNIKYSYENYLRGIRLLKRMFAFDELFFLSRHFIYGESYITIYDFIKNRFRLSIIYKNSNLKEFQIDEKIAASPFARLSNVLYSFFKKKKLCHFDTV